MGSTMQKVNDVHEEIKHVQATAGDLVSQEVRQRIELFNDKLTRLETEATNTLSDWSAWLSQNFKQHLEACAKVQQVREKDILGKMFDEFLASLDPKAELVEVKKWVLLFEAGWEHLTTDQRAERHAEASDAMDKALTSCKKACDGLFKRFKEASNSKEWPKAQETWQELCDAVEILSRLDLNVLQGREANLMKQLSMMPRHYGCRPHNEGKLQRISEQIKMGDFSEAIYALCQTLPDQDDEQRLLQAMNESVDNALHVLGKSWHPQDPADTSKMLELLKNFIDEVGDNPPDVLLSLCEAAQRQCQAKLPQLRATISAAVEHVKGASSSETRDLGGLANSLQEFARFHDAATDEDRNSIKEAVQGFKDAVCQKCLRAKQDIQEQNGEALRQDLRPIETWKEAFIKLDEPKKSMLLSYLFPDVTDDFLSWMHSIIGSASGAVGRTLEDLTKKNGFREINVVLDMQGQVSQLFQGETVDSAPVTKYLASKAAEACAALNAGQIEAFGAEYKALREAMSELPESLKVREHLLKVEGALDSVLEPRMKEIAGARDVEQAKAACFYMRRIADDVPVIHDRVLKSMATGLTLLQSTVDDSTKFLGMLCLQLQLSDMGKKIVDEHRAVFGAAADRARNALFKRTGEIAPNVIAKKVEGSNKDLEGSSLTDSDRNDLRAALEAREKKLEELQGEWLLGSQSMEEAESKAKSAISLLHFRGQAPVSNEAARNLLTHLAAAYTVARSGPAFFASARAGIQQLENQDALVSPHNGQMVTLYRLLNIGARPGIFSATLKYLQSVVTGSGSKSLCNHLAEVKTGEGKCLTLGMLAAFFALSGLEVDVVCYQPYLVEQDSKAMAPFYKLLGIDGVTKAGRRQIEYHTFDDICEKRLENIQAASKALLSKGGTQGISAPESSTASRALLVDEADVFFGRRFYGQAFNGAFVLDSPEAKSLVKYIYNEQKHGRVTRLDYAILFN